MVPNLGGTQKESITMQEQSKWKLKQTTHSIDRV